MTDISFNGFTWTLAETVSPVLDALGEPCVAGPVTLTARTPAPTGTGADTRHGGMVNPVSLTAMGYDGRTPVAANQQHYDASLNAEASLPLALPAGASLCSMQSSNLGVTDLMSQANPEMVSHFGCLSVMPSIPAAGTFFRPPYAGTEKPVFLTSQIRTDWLPNLGLTSDPIDDQTAFTDYKVDVDTHWLTLPQYLVFQPNAQPTARLAPRYQQQWYPSYRGWYVGRLGILAASNHARRVEFLNRLIRYGIDCYYTAKATSDGVFFNGAGFGPGGQFFAIAVAGHYLERPDFLELLTRPWENASGAYAYGNPDLTGSYVGSFWEQTTPYYSDNVWSGYDMPAEPSLRPGKRAVYGDARNFPGVTGNDSRKDPTFECHAIGNTLIQYPTHPLTSAAGWGGYYHVAMPAFTCQFIAAKLLGVDKYYPFAAQDLFYQHVNDPKLWSATDISANVYDRDNDAFGGSGNGFVYDMWQTHGSTINRGAAVPGNMTLRITR